MKPVARHSLPCRLARQMGSESLNSAQVGMWAGRAGKSAVESATSSSLGAGPKSTDASLNAPGIFRSVPTLPESRAALTSFTTCFEVGCPFSPSLISKSTKVSASAIPGPWFLARFGLGLRPVTSNDSALVYRPRTSSMLKRSAASPVTLASSDRSVFCNADVPPFWFSKKAMSLKITICTRRKSSPSSPTSSRAGSAEMPASAATAPLALSNKLTRAAAAPASK
mmetsp:Transcript_14028/g.34041  ORF Transcript_14028/g.34041 Transcript_14028/m.34041 type:complete len:225 (-) Transcript_14028:136-810(-)